MRLTRGTPPWEDDGLPSCALDVAEGLVEMPDGRSEGGMHTTLEAIGEILGVTRERVRQIEESGIRRLKRQGIEYTGPRDPKTEH